MSIRVRNTKTGKEANVNEAGWQKLQATGKYERVDEPKKAAPRAPQQRKPVERKVVIRDVTKEDPPTEEKESENENES